MGNDLWEREAVCEVCKPELQVCLEIEDITVKVVRDCVAGC